VTGPNAAALRLGQRLDELHKVIESLRDAEQDAISKRMDADISESKAFLTAEGSMDIRRHKARVDTEQIEFQALAAEAHVRHLVRLMKEAQARVDAGRTYSADLRAELQTIGRDGTP